LDAKEKGELKGHTDGVTFLLSVGHYVWSASMDSSVRIWDPKTEKCKKVIKLSTPAMSLLLLSGNEVWVGGDRSIHRLGAQSLKSLGSFEAHEHVIHHLIWAEDKVWSCSSDQTIKVWDPKTTKCLHVITGHHTRLFNLSSDGKCVWSAGWNKIIMMWNQKTYEFVRQIQSHHIDALSSLLLIEDEEDNSSEMWSCSWDKTICIWSVTRPQLPPQLPTGAPVKGKKPNYSATSFDGLNPGRSRSSTTS